MSMVIQAMSVILHVSNKDKCSEQILCSLFITQQVMGPEFQKIFLHLLDKLHCNSLEWPAQHSKTLVTW